MFLIYYEFVLHVLLILQRLFGKDRCKIRHLPNYSEEPFFFNANVNVSSIFNQKITLWFAYGQIIALKGMVSGSVVCLNITL